MSIVFQGVDRCVPGLLCVNSEVVKPQKITENSESVVFSLLWVGWLSEFPWISTFPAFPLPTPTMIGNWWISGFQTVFKIPSWCLVCFVGSLYHFFLLPRVSGSVFVSVFADENNFNHIAIRKSKCVAFKGYLRLLTKSWDASRLKRSPIPLINICTIVVPLCIQEFGTSLVQLQFHQARSAETPPGLRRFWRSWWAWLWRPTAVALRFASWTWRPGYQ